MEWLPSSVNPLAKSDSSSFTNRSKGTEKWPEPPLGVESDLCEGEPGRGVVAIVILGCLRDEQNKED